MTQGAVKSSFRLALFKNDASVVWHASIPARLSTDLLAKDIHAFLAARSISQALLSGIQHVKEAEEQDPRPDHLSGESSVQIRPPSDSLVALCKNGSVIAGFPRDWEGGLWLGMFATGFSLQGTENICNLLYRIALSSELLSASGASPVSKLSLFWKTMTTTSSRTQTADEVVEKTMKQIKDIIRFNGVQ